MILVNLLSPSSFLLNKHVNLTHKIMNHYFVRGSKKRFINLSGTNCLSIGEQLNCLFFL